jgi:hypothetical protein
MSFRFCRDDMVEAVLEELHITLANKIPSKASKEFDYVFFVYGI